MTPKRSLLSFANVASMLALVVALSGGAYAAAELPRHSVGAKQLKGSSVNSAKVKDGSLQVLDFRAGQLPSGPKGERGEPATRYWARIVTLGGGAIFSATGTLQVAYAGSTGQYTVTHPAPVADCATVVTLNRGVNGGFGTQVAIPSVSLAAPPTIVNISFVNAAGTAVTPLGFNVATFC